MNDKFGISAKTFSASHCETLQFKHNKTNIIKQMHF